MELLIVPISATLAVLALCLSVISLVFQWVRRKEHPDVSTVRSELYKVRGDLAELWDKFDHQVKRDRVRRIRAAKEDQTESEGRDGGAPDLVDVSATAVKAELRQRAAALLQRR